MIKMEVDNVTDIIPRDDFGFMMNVGALRKLSIEDKSLTLAASCRSNAPPVESSMKMR